MRRPYLGDAEAALAAAIEARREALKRYHLSPPGHRAVRRLRLLEATTALLTAETVLARVRAQS